MFGALTVAKGARALRIAGIALLAVGCVGCRVVLRSDLSEDDANQLVVALDRASIAAEKRVQAGPAGGYAVEVPAADAGRALRVLEREQLPRRMQPGFDALYGETGLLATPSEERMRRIAAVAGELSRSLQRLPGVLDARVHLAPPEAVAALDVEPAPMRAAVLIQRRAEHAALDEGPIRQLISGAVQGLPPGAVTIVQVAAEHTPAEPPALARVGPFTTSRASAAALRAVLGAALTLDLLLAVGLVVLMRWKRRAATA